MNALESWRKKFTTRAGKPAWPGPRPLEEDDPFELLVGRDAHAREFTSAVLDHPLVVLTGDSGIGKTSLLKKKLVPTLEDQRFAPLVCRVWTSTRSADTPGERADPALMVAEEIKHAVDPSIDPPGTMADRFWKDVDDLYDGRAVLILDQFEELVRYQPRLFDDALRWIQKLNRETSIRIVISLRAEYLHRLRPLEAKARPFTMTEYTLRALDTADDAGLVIDSGQIASIDPDGNEVLVPAIEPAVRVALVGAWERDRAVAEIGLLHLQAVLYSLATHVEEVADDGGGYSAVDPLAPQIPVTLVDVTNMEGRLALANAEGAGRGDAPLTLFEYGLREAVKHKLGHCRAACADLGLDPVLVAGTEAIVEGIVPHLSSGGFKLVREEWELAERAIGHECRQLGSRDDARSIYDQLSGWRKDPSKGDLLGKASPEASAWASTVCAFELFRRSVDWAPWDHDEADVSAGPMLGMPPRAVLFEELRRFTFALEWLEASAIVRSSTPSIGRTMISLIHDGFGPALESGAVAAQAKPDATLSRVTVARGEEYDWQHDQSAVPQHAAFRGDGPERPKVLTNLRWRDCTVSASFAHVVFLNCDFRGTRFDQCGFSGVTFVNCLLDNASITECTIYGPVDHPMDGRDAIVALGDKYLPDFSVEVPESTVRMLERYRGLPSTPAWDPEAEAARANGYGASDAPAETTEEAGGPTAGQQAELRYRLYSRTSGIAAIPGFDAVPGITLGPQRSGLTMAGGRLSSLLVRSNTFADGGMLALRHIAGSSLDIVEHRGGHIQIFDSAIRGLTISAPVDPAVERTATTLSVSYTFLANAWFGDGLRGSTDPTQRSSTFETRVHQLLNLNDQDTFTVALIDTPFSGAVNIDEAKGIPRPDFSGGGEDSDLPDENREAAAAIRSDTRSRALRTDYRSRPAQLEIQRLIDAGVMRVDDLLVQ